MIAFLLQETSLDSLHLKTKWIFKWHRSDDYRQEGWVIPYTVIWLVLQGSRTVIFNDSTYNLRPHHVVVLPPYTTVSVKPSQKKEEEAFHHLALACEAKIGVFDLVYFYQFPKVMQLMPSNTLNDWSSLWENMLQRAEDYQDQLGAMENRVSENHQESKPVILSLDQSIDYVKIESDLYQWFSYLFLLCKPFLPESHKVIDPRVRDACTFMKNHLDEKLITKDIAQRVFVSESHLRYLFGEAFKLSPMKYLNRIRLQKVKELLLTSSLTLREITERTGFLHPSQLSRAFRHAEMMSPSKYRKMAKNYKKYKGKGFLSVE